MTVPALTRAEIATIANSVMPRGRAPRLSATSEREDVIYWLQANDPNGAYTDELMRAEHAEPLTKDEAWEALADVLQDEALDALDAPG